MYADSVCQRLQPVLEGLLALAPAAAAAPAPPAGVPGTSVPPPAQPFIPPAAIPAASASRSGTSALNVVLAFASGVLLMCLAALGLLLWQRQQQASQSILAHIVGMVLETV